MIGKDYEKAAMKAAEESTAEKRKVGAVVVAQNGGYTSGWNYHPDGGPCEDAQGNTREGVIHAEVCALNNFKEVYAGEVPRAIYITHPPCSNCELAIYDAGILTANICVVENFMKFDKEKPRVDLIPLSVFQILDKTRFPLYFKTLALINNRDVKTRRELLVDLAKEIRSFIGVYEVGTILAYGAKKYKPNNWRNVDDINRYYAALARHVLEVDIHGNKALDADSCQLALAHALTNILFILELEN